MHLITQFVLALQKASKRQIYSGRSRFEYENLRLNKGYFVVLGFFTTRRQIDLPRHIKEKVGLRWSPMLNRFFCKVVCQFGAKLSLLSPSTLTLPVLLHIFFAYTTRTFENPTRLNGSWKPINWSPQACCPLYSVFSEYNFSDIFTNKSSKLSSTATGGCNFLS